MLRIKRSVEAQYNTDVGYVAAAQGGGAVEPNGAVGEGDAMAALERNTTLSGFVESSTGPVGGGSGTKEEPKVSSEVAKENPDAIDLGDDDDEMQVVH
jgi:pre-mRNA-splicing factor SYF1